MVTPPTNPATSHLYRILSRPGNEDDPIHPILTSYREGADRAHVLYLECRGRALGPELDAMEETAWRAHDLARQSLIAATSTVPTTLAGIAALAEAVLVHQGPELDQLTRDAFIAIREGAARLAQCS